MPEIAEREVEDLGYRVVRCVLRFETVAWVIPAGSLASRVRLHYLGFEGGSSRFLVSV